MRRFLLMSLIVINSGLLAFGCQSDNSDPYSGQKKQGLIEGVVEHKKRVWNSVFGSSEKPKNPY